MRPRSLPTIPPLLWHAGHCSKARGLSKLKPWCASVASAQPLLSQGMLGNQVDSSRRQQFGQFDPSA
eukprot:CAMPEP_0117686826 /NCGR_PEP_ID=MMETSP0804-20121206/22725_1 /TAXON_ID=1074897 /ORGANISM="Tetraselmis astigmatica, Strain CCMP880" /LENGTH=66 /DNA_ID=CAMNT_0005498681 /DNA_START=63 /DNA_END=259 /DNA_ORIENTATION=-